MTNQKCTRSIDTTISEIDKNLIQFSFASEAPYRKLNEKTKTPYDEILLINDTSVDFSRLTDQLCPLLLEHDAEKQIGVCEKAWREDARLYAIVRFSDNKEAQDILTDVKNLIRRNVSFGYIINDYQVDRSSTIPKVIVTSFTPYEISIVSIPADSSVGYLRSLETNVKELDMEKEDKEKEEMVEVETEKETAEVEAEKPAVETEPETKPESESEETSESTETESQPETEEEKVDEEKETVEDDEEKEIRAAGELLNQEDLAEECIKNKRSLQDFKNMVKTKCINSNKSNKENKMEKFSLSKAIRNACKQYKADVSEEFETKVINENRRNLNFIDGEFDVIVTTSQLRALAPSGAVGGALVNTNYLPQEFVPALRPQLTLAQTGYRVIPVDGPSISFATVTSGATASMYSLDGELADGDMNFSLKTLQPRKAGVCVPIPYSLLLQARPEIDAIVEGDIVAALDELRDQMILTGTGSDNQPTGIAATSGVNTMAPSAICTWEGVCQAEQMIRNSNDFGPLCWVMNGTNKVKFETTLKDNSANGGYLCEDDKIKNMPVFVNNALDNDTVILGNFSEVVVADFDGLYLKVDDITYIKKQAVQVIATKAFDCTVRRPKSFVVTK